MIPTEAGASSSNWRKNMRAGDLRNLDLDLNFLSPYCPGEHESIFLLLPRDMPRKSCSELLRRTESMRLVDEKKISAGRKSFSGSFYPGRIHASEFSFVSHKNNSKTKGVSLSGRILSDLTAVKSRIPSPNFRFGMNRRSCSVKESSAVPKLISPYIFAKPVSIRSDDPDSLQYSGRGKSSPLRRLLDPILKLKTPKSQPFDFKPLQRKLNFQSSCSESIHANLQFMVKSGLPLFKFMVDNNGCDILATTVKRLSNSILVYTFYSVHETKTTTKKGNVWMARRNTAKGCGYAYNVIGEMKVSNYDGQDQNSGSESVVYDACVPNRELGVIVTNRYTSRTTVILQDGIHGSPNEGAPSPLIERWKSVGSCDCGGWDIGCNIRILSDENEALGHVPNQFDLSVQGGRNRPIFSLVAMKSGMYSVKFDASISLLQAFSVCVAVMNCKKASDVLQTRQLCNTTDSADSW